MISLVSGEVIDPSTKQVIKKYSVLCSQCGLSEAQIQNYRGIPKKGKRNQTNAATA